MVLLRAADPAVQLQALRTALSLSLGDRPADLLVGGDGIGALGPPLESEAEHCLQTLRKLPLSIQVDAGAAPAPVHDFAEVLPHPEFVDRLAVAAFVQVF